MVRLDVIPDRTRQVIVLQITALPDKPLAYIELTPGMLAETLAGLVSAWCQMGMGDGKPSLPGTYATMPAIVNPEWRVGISPVDELLAVSFRALASNPTELWLTYALPSGEAEKFLTVLNEKLGGPYHEGTA